MAPRPGGRGPAEVTRGLVSAGAALLLLLQGRKGDFSVSESLSVSSSAFTLSAEAADCCSLFNCSISRRASNLKRFLGARHMGDKAVLLVFGLEASEDFESGDPGLGLLDSEL